MAFWKESMINRFSNLINRNRSAAKISQVLCSSNIGTPLCIFYHNHKLNKFIPYVTSLVWLGRFPVLKGKH